MPRNRSLTLVDYDGQASVMQLQMANVETPIVELAAWVTLKSQIDAVSLGLPVRESSQAFSLLASSAARPTDPESNRANKWLVTYEDTSQWLNPPDNDVPNPNFRKVFNFEIPMADTSMRVNNSDIVFTRAGIGGANPVEFDNLVSTIETIVKSPSGGTIQVQQIRLETRSV